LSLLDSIAGHELIVCKVLKELWLMRRYRLVGVHCVLRELLLVDLADVRSGVLLRYKSVISLGTSRHIVLVNLQALAIGLEMISRRILDI
jgi:hypothetical protein